MHSPSFAELGSLAVVVLASAGSLAAQNVFHGNGIPSAYVENSPAVLGQVLQFEFGSATTPLPIAFLAISDGVGPVFIPDPLFGWIGLNLFSPAYVAIGFGLDASGHTTLSIPLAPGFLPPTAPPMFAHAATIESAAFSITKTVRLDWARPNAWEPVAPLAGIRQLHTATALGSGPRDNVTEVLITGGATHSFVIPTPLATCELFSPLTRATTPLPNLSVPRACHRAVRLPDGRVLVTGGVTTGGTVLATCEAFAPAGQTFVPIAAMSTPRSGHAMTLLDDGRVLVSGGVSNWQNTATAFIAALNTAQDSAEVYDPATNSWSALPNMASKRLGHSQTKLADGRVLIVSGIRGGYTGAFFTNGQIPQYTTTCELFDPTTGTFAPTAPLTHTEAGFAFSGRAYHGASLLPSGDVLITGGFVAQQGGGGWANDDTIPVAFCDTWNATSGTWSPTASLPSASAWHSHEPHRNGAIVCGGFTGVLTSLQPSSQVVFHDGVTATALAGIGLDGAGLGTAQPRAAHTCTRLHDGSFLVYGGGVWPATIADGWIYTPQ